MPPTQLPPIIGRLPETVRRFVEEASKPPPPEQQGLPLPVEDDGAEPPVAQDLPEGS